MRNIYIAMKRIVHKEQSQRRVPEEQLVGCETVVEGFCAQVMEPASEPRAIEVRRFFLRYRKKSEQCAGIWAQC